jgi:DNA end-binding protein Ku
VVPEDKTARLYILLREALKRAQKVAVATLVFHERELLAVIKPNGRALMLDVLYFADEIMLPKGLGLPKTMSSWEEEEMALTERLIDSMTDHFAPEKYTDTYREGLRAVIEKKREGATLKTRPRRPRIATEDEELLVALKASIRKAEGKRERALAA